MARSKRFYASQRAAGILIPLIAVSVNGYALYIVTVNVAIDYLIKAPEEFRVPKRTASGIAIIVIQYVLFFPVFFSWLRFVQVLITNPGYVPRRKPPSQPTSNSKSERDLEDGPFLDRAAVRMHEIPFPPEYEQFSERQVFTCSSDGLPKFCNYCWNWKSDRTHHCHEVNRCVRRFDHYCPWVGGVVSETNTKFFIQFTGYASIYSVFLLVVCIWTLVTSKNDCKRADNAGISCSFDSDLLSGHWIAGIALSGVFGFISAGMFFRFVDYVTSNRTTIESLEAGAPRTCVAVRIQEWELQKISMSSGYIFLTFPLSQTQKATTPIISEKVDATQNHQLNHNSNEISHAEAPEETVTKDSEDKDTIVEPTVSDAIQNQEAEKQKPRQSQPPPASNRYAIFIILQLKPGSNIWNIGVINNVKAVMGEHIIDWFIPWKFSPCIDEHNPGDDISEYKLGKDFYIMEKVALPHRYDERGLRKQVLYSENEKDKGDIRRTKSGGGRKKRRRRRSSLAHAA